MPTIVMTKWPSKVDGSVRAKAMDFLQKLAADDTTLGLHVEPIRNSADPRVRTGRVDQFWRAVMFRLDDGGERHYVVHGVFEHDRATEIARRITLTVNPVNGFPQITEVASRPAPPVVAAPVSQVEPPVRAEPAQPLLIRQGRNAEQLVDVLGIPPDVANAALAARGEDELLALAGQHEGWLGLMLLDLATGDSIESITERLEVSRPAAQSGDATALDSLVLDSLKRPAAQTQFAFIDDQDELRRVIESGDLKAWRTFLHPEQRRYVGATFSGPFRLSGGAGTGKTVVLIHRARALARRDPKARIVLTTFTTNLAEALREDVAELDPSLAPAGRLGEPGVFATGVDSLAAAVIRRAGPDVGEAVAAVLGGPRAAVNSRTPAARWRDVVEAASTPLPPSIATEAFLSAEYGLVVLPNRIRTAEEYLRVRRPGRGVALDRARRHQVWDLIEAYRAQTRLDGTLDYAEAAAVAAAYLEMQGPLVDHVLVDEGQDLSPVHWQMLRALVAPGADDLFLAEDSHQRIYSSPVVLGRYGIRIVGRSRRLTLNYRTTAQNLRYALGILEGGSYVDLEENAETTGYRSARTGPVPRVEKVDSLAAELDAVGEIVRGWIKDGTPPDAIAVLVHDRYQRQRVTGALTQAGLPAREIDRDRPVPERVSVLTMHRAKGTEFSKVVLAGVGWTSDAEQRRLAALDPAERHDAELRARSLVYVAATRARDELAVVRR
jgi:superfamily I DNA/RNA helicase